MPKTLTLFLLLLVLSILSPTATSVPTLGLDSFFSDALRRDPSASNDSFPSLPSSLRRSLSSPIPSNPISALLSLHVTIPLVIKLVGPFSSSAPSTLLSFTSAALSDSPFHVISSKPDHHLSIHHNLHVSPHLSDLAPSIASVIRSHLDTSPSPFLRSALRSVPYSAVDKIIQQDFLRDRASSPPSFYIYLINLENELRDLKDSKGYAYSFDGNDASSAASAVFSKCLGTVWTGKERYVWIDLSAGPVDYGPAISGDGLIPKGEFHPLASLHGRPRSEKSLLSDLASVVLSAYEVLLVPSLRIPVHHESAMLIQFVHIRGENVDPTGLDFNFIRKTLEESELAYKDQTFSFKSYDVKYSECPICSFAISRATNFYTSRFLFENYTLIVSEYLDSKRLHQVLSNSMEEMHQAARIPEEEDYAKILPVYVFDLEYDKLLLLDRYHQAVAFRDMVIAVRTRSSQTVSDYTCNGRHVLTQTRNLDRPIIGSVLQSMWGISPTHLLWSPQHNRTVMDYTWSSGQTPFGPFSESSSLSFVQRDAAKRNVLLTSMNYTITSAIDVLQSMAMHGGDRKLLKQSKHAEFLQRWNLLKYKLDKVVSAISLLDYEKAMYYLRSTDHDLYAIHTLVYEATQKLDASLVCFKDPPFPWLSVFLWGAFVSGLFYVYSKRDKIFKNKRKRF